MKVYCPYCKKEVQSKIEKRNVKEFKGIKLDTFQNVAICNECGQDLYINQIENENVERIYNIYREKANIINGQDIVCLREKYNISQRELTSILGLGKMTINRYENGGIPTKAQSDYIRLLIENESEFLKKVEEAYRKKLINNKTYKKVINKINNEDLIKKDMQDALRKYIEVRLFRTPDIYNGYKKFDLSLVENILSYIASKVDNLTITSMNKYLWFIDMLSFNKRGVGITGLTYQKQQYGPTISDFRYDDISRLDEKFKKIDYEGEDGKIRSEIKSKNNFDLSELNKDEKEIINYVIEALKRKSVTDISIMSHLEEGWIKSTLFENISFEYAMSLKFGNN